MTVWGQPPEFWSRAQGLAGPTELLLAPFGAVAGRVVSWRAARPGVRAGVPVLCCGNATVGGTGKTILALDLVRRLERRGVAPHVLTRGHGGTAGRRGVHRVDLSRDTASVVGDEALLLARLAPTWVARDRAASARAAVAAGAGVLVLDDGLQNPTLARDAGFLVIDGEAGFGNGRVLPAGPLREHPAKAASRARAVVLIGEDRRGIAASLRYRRPILPASLRLDPAAVSELSGRSLLAFAGIGRPAKFFDGLREAGVSLAGTRAFPDHHPYADATLEALRREAASSGASLFTTEKDLARIGATAASALGIRAIGVALAWADPTRVERVLDAVLAEAACVA